MPHNTIDPVVIAARIVLALQTIVSRENNPIDPVVITVGSIHGGTQANIIPDEVKLELSVRTLHPRCARGRSRRSVASRREKPRQPAPRASHSSSRRRQPGRRSSTIRR